MSTLPSNTLRSLLVLIGALAPAAALAQGTVIFSGGDVSIVAGDGSSRPARQGDVVRQGERITTGPGALAQVRFADGSFAGVRPDSNVELRQYRPTGDGQGITLMLAAGGVRVLNVETTDRPAPLPFQVQSPEGANVVLRGGDMETGRARGQPPESSFVARINVGIAVARTNAGDLPLPLNNVNAINRGGITPMPPNALPPPSPMAAQDRTGPPGKLPAGDPGSPPQPGGQGSPPRSGGPGSPPQPGGPGVPQQPQFGPPQAGVPAQPLPPGGPGFTPFAVVPGIRPGSPQPGIPVGTPPPQISVAPTAASAMIGNVSKPPGNSQPTANPQPPGPGGQPRNPPQFVAPPPGGSPTVVGAGGPGGSPFQGTTFKPASPPPPR